MELLSLFGSFCTYFFGQFLFLDNTGTVGKAIVTFIIVIVNVAVVFTAIMLMFGMLRDMAAQFAIAFRNTICCVKTDNANKNVILAQDSDFEDRQNGITKDLEA